MNTHTNRIGIRKEDEKKRNEYRAPLVPADVGILLTEHDTIEVIVETGHQPETVYPRAFSDDEYTAIGATVGSMRDADIIFGIKEIPIADLLPNKTYAFFSHTYKGQPHNMPMLRKLAALGCSLIDYELIVEDVDDDLYQVDRYRRKVFFGHMAGYAGVIDTLHGLGQRYATRGIETPFGKVKRAMDYTSDFGNFGDFAQAMAGIRDLAIDIRENGIPESIAPVVIGLTGHGNVGKAVRTVLDNLPLVEITPEQLIDWNITPDESHHHVYLVHFSRAYREPAKMQQYLPRLSALIHGSKWLPHQERIITRAFLQGDSGQLEIIGDISCDPNGAIEISYPTYPDAPFYTYLPAKDDLAKTWNTAQREASCVSGIHAEGVAVMAVTNLPTEFARGASVSFSAMLNPFIAELAKADLDVPFAELDLSRQLKRAFILHKGELTPDFAKLEDHITPRVAIIGAGRMSETVLSYLVEHTDYDFIIADANLDNAQALAKRAPSNRVTRTEHLALATDGSDNMALKAILNDVDVVVSLLPAFLHPVIAETAIETRTHLVTASYVSEAMQALDKRAKDAGVLLLNEVGVDPGLDHMSAMKIIDTLHAEGKTITAFTSFCGGLPLPETVKQDNPLHFKASWSPAGILSAVNRPARFIEKSAVLEQAPLDVLRGASEINIAQSEHPLEGYPNGNSEQYQLIYGLADTETLIRGTLRFAGWSDIFITLHELGWFSDVPSTTIALKTRDADLSDAVREVVTWLTLHGAEDDSVSAHDYLREQFTSKDDLAYFDGELDQLVMVHTFDAQSSNGQTERITSELFIVGDENGHSAMAKTVGYPCAIAVQMVMDGTYAETGVQIPTTPDLYNPILDALLPYGIQFKEQVSITS